MQIKRLSEDIDSDEWITYFKKLSLQSFCDNSLQDEVKELEGKVVDNELNTPITIREIKNNIRKLKNNKACGEDLILNEMIKSGCSVLLPALCKLFNLVLKSHTFPETWNITMQTMIHKSGNHLDCNNYRGISITSCLGKLLTSVLQSRILNYLESNRILSDKQTAFRPGFSTSDHLFTLRSLINKYIKVNKKKLYVCFIDFRKAFDKVWRDGLFLKLLKAGINGNIYKLIKQMYQKTRMKIKFSDGLSKAFTSNAGIRQGDGLSPLLFNVFINDLNDIFDHTCDPAKIGQLQISNLLYADDLLLISESEKGLQNSLDKLAIYCKKWHLDVNMDKTKAMVISSSGKLPKAFNVKFNKIQIASTNSYKYLA